METLQVYISLSQKLARWKSVRFPVSFIVTRIVYIACIFNKLYFTMFTLLLKFSRKWNVNPGGNESQLRTSKGGGSSDRNCMVANWGETWRVRILDIFEDVINEWPFPIFFFLLLNLFFFCFSFSLLSLLLLAVFIVLYVKQKR